MFGVKGVSLANLIAEGSFLNNAHADVQNVLHQLLTSMRLARLLLLIRAGSEDGHAEHVQGLCLNSNSDHLTVSLLAEALFKQALNHSLQLTLNTALQDERCLCVLNTNVLATRMGGVDAWNLLAREQGLGGQG